MFEMGLWVWNGKQWTKCKAKLPLTSVMRERALRVQFTPFSVKSSILQLVMALNSLSRQWKFDRFWLHIFTRAKPISTKCISSKYTASWKLECFVESFLLKLISSGKAYNSQALWHSWLQNQRMIKEICGADDWKIDVFSRMTLCWKTIALIQRRAENKYM